MTMAKMQVMSGPSKDDGELNSPGKTPIEKSYDLQDRMMELIGKGNNLANDDRGAIFSNLTTLVGKDQAGKIMSHIYLFNQHPDVQKLPFEEKVKAFYKLGSNDKDVQGYIDKTKNLGYGAGPNLRHSFSQINQQILGVAPTDVAQTSNADDLKKKVMIRVSK